MTIHTRRLYFYVLTLVFIFLTPILIGYALGYTIDFKDRTLGKTGGIFVKSTTPKLSIFLDGAFIKETSLLSGSALLVDLQPGKHLFRLEKTGYSSWYKTLSVSPSSVTELRNVILIPKQIEYATSTKTDSALASKTSAQTQTSFILDAKHNLLQKTPVTPRVIAHDIHSFAVLNGTLFFINNSGFLNRLNADNSITIIGRPGFFLTEKPAQFIPADSDPNETAIIDSSGGLYLLENNETLTIVGGGAQDARFDKTAQKLLIRKERELDVFWIGENTYQPFQKRNMTNSILSLDSSILDAQWYFKDNAHIILRTKNGIFITELDGRGGGNTIELVSGQTDALFTTPDRPNAIFFKKDKTLYTIEL